MPPTVPIIDKASRLIQDMLGQFPSSPIDAGELEPRLSEILTLIMENPLEREQFVRLFVNMLQGQHESPEWLIAYCMRTLRWPEIKQAAEAVRVSNDAKRLPLAWEVLDAYEDDDEWFGVHLFKRYSKS